MTRLSFAALLTAAGLLCAADFQTGLAAYNRGDFATAVKEWEPIAAEGDPNAQYNLGLLYARGQGVPQDYAKAAEWYQRAADKGVAAAQYNLGVMYANGQGVPQNSQDASKWFLKAADQGLGDAASGLGRIYYEEGAFRNYAEAEKWYRKAADQGVASAAFNLGVMYDIGQGVAKNYQEALRWYQKAADGGYAAAYTNIGILYYNAQGVKRDLVQAYNWFGRARKLGDPRAAELITTCAAKMKPGDVKKAEAVVASWQPPKPAGPAIDATKLFAPPAPPQVASADRGAQPGVAPPAPAVESKATAAPAVQNVWTGVGRIVAVGDVHGDYEQFAAVLESAGLIDGNGNWTGGKAHLVQTGDVVDRGPNSKEVMGLLMKLEKQAASAGGAVHSLIGNHEAMDVYGDLRYVSPAEFAAFAPDAAALQGSANRADLTATAQPQPTANGPSGTAPGYAAYRAAFGPNGLYGKWIRSHNAAIKIDRTLFLHAGLGEKYLDWTLDRIDQEVRSELNDLTRLHGGIVTDKEGPLWNASLAKGDERQLAPLVDRILKHFDVDRIVVGHTYANAAITPRFGGKVVLIDIGLPRVYDNIGKLGCLVIEDSRAYALHRGQKLDLPADDNGPEMLRYLRAAAALDPKPSPLATRILELEHKSRPN